MVLDVIPSNCERIREAENLDKASGKQIFQEGNNARIGIEQAKNQLSGEYVDYVKACEVNIPDNVETKTYYHASPSNNEESIKEKGLKASRAEDCANGNGVYVTERKSEAEGWAETLGAERAQKEFDVYKVEVPSCMTVTSDEVPINKRAVPESEIVCSNTGIPSSHVKKIDTKKVDPKDESKMGGTRY